VELENCKTVKHKLKHRRA